MRVDAHLHLWRRARGDYGWLTPELGPLWRDFEAADAQAELSACGIDQAILVQAAPTIAETRFLLETAAAAPWVAGVVGWVDLTKPDVASVFADLAQNPLLRGVRPMVHDEPDADWLLREDVERGLSEVGAEELTFDALVRPAHLANLRTVIARHPDLRFVVDHGGKPDLAGGHLERWGQDLKTIAAFPNVFCKLSGLVTERGPGWTVEDLQRPFGTLLELFGPGRLIWGSDWPVCTLAASYSAWVAATDTLLKELSLTERARVLGGTAAEVYRLEGVA